MNILILGGDGYLGWPTAMYLSGKGHDVTVVDNYFRRNECTKLNVGMLYQVPSLVERAKIWHAKSGHKVRVAIGDLASPDVMRSFFDGRATFQWGGDSGLSSPPDVVIHYAEQPSAPYSQMDCHTADLTLVNNLRVTNNLMYAVRDYARETHIVKLGTMGEYGTPNIDIEEGWLDIEHNGRKDTFLFPRQASSLYHTTKIMDTDLLWFGVRTWGLRVTDLMQGPVYGIETDECMDIPELRTIFNYDEIFGTVVNRFVVQAIIEYPLTVYGKGNQVRGYLNIRDTLQCVERAIGNSPAPGQLQIFNQIMELFSVNELASRIQRVGRQRGHDVQIQQAENPRQEAEEHYYNPSYQGLIELGVKPHYLTDKRLDRLFEIVEDHRDSIRSDVIFNGVKW